MTDSINNTGNQLRILSWNIGMLPFSDLFSDPDSRAAAIAGALMTRDYDIIVFQEAFTSASRTILQSRLGATYPYSYGPANSQKLSFRFNSGLWILSRLPMVIRKEIEFSNSAGLDALARKGAVLLEGTYHDLPFQLITMHLQDDIYPREIRDQQLREVFDQLIYPFSDMTTPQIICGDFNTDAKESASYKGMLTILQAEDGMLSGDIRVTFDDSGNDAFRSPHPNPRLIDYILTRNSGVIQWISRRVAVMKMRWGKGFEYLSDHNALEAFIVFRKGELLSRVY